MRPWHLADESESVSPLQSYLELLRLPNVFTAVADVAMGFFFVQAAWAFSDDPQQSLLPIGLWTVGLLAAASALLYSAGMVLNDVFDIELDRQEQPYRPLPSGRIPLSSARWLGWQLLTLGIMLASGTAVMLAKVPAGPHRQLRPLLAAGDRRRGAGRAHRALQRRTEADLPGPRGHGRLPHAQRAVGHERAARAVADRALGGRRGHWRLYRRRDLVRPQRCPPQRPPATRRRHAGHAGRRGAGRRAAVADRRTLDASSAADRSCGVGT